MEDVHSQSPEERRKRLARASARLGHGVVKRWREGYVMVYGQRVDRSDETRFKRNSARLFYRLFERFGEMSLPEGAGDFRLIDRKGVEVLLDACASLARTGHDFAHYKRSTVLRRLERRVRKHAGDGAGLLAELLADLRKDARRFCGKIHHRPIKRLLVCG